MDILFATPSQAALAVISAQVWYAVASDDPRACVRENQYRLLKIAYRSARLLEGSLRRPNLNRVVTGGSRRCIVIAAAIGSLCHASWSLERP